jgi:hypothetical protein
MITEREYAQLRWFQLMAEATEKLDQFQQVSLSAWLAAGEKRSTWPGWPQIIGARPEEKKASVTGISDQRKRA